MGSKLELLVCFFDVSIYKIGLKLEVYFNGIWENWRGIYWLDWLLIGMMLINFYKGFLGFM